MTEAEWLACADPRLSLVFIEGKSSPRKARLFACAVGRALWPYLGDEHSCCVVEIAEQYADKHSTEDDLRKARDAALDNKRGWASQVASCAGDHGAWQGARLTMVCLQHAQSEREGRELAKRTALRSRGFIACIFGNPFRPVSLNPSCLTSTVFALAEGIYAERAFDRLPILADALQDAGCENIDILSHCRAEGPHVRGCWVVDLLLDKK